MTYDIICNGVIENPGVLTVMFLKQFEYGIEKHNLNSCEVGVEVLKMAGAD